MSTVIEISKPNFDGNSMVKIGLHDGDDIISDYNAWNYWIVMLSATEWEIRSGSSDEMTINPNTYSSSPHVAKILLTESGGSIIDCQYFVNGVEITPSFSFTARGSVDKTGFSMMGSYNDPHTTQSVLNLTTQSFVNLADSTITTTSHTNDTQEADSETAARQYVTVVEGTPPPPPSSGGTRLPPPPLIARF